MPKNPQMVKLGRQSRDVRIATQGTAMPPEVAAKGRTAYWNKYLARVNPDGTLSEAEAMKRARALWASEMRAAREGWKRRKDEA